MVMWGGPPLQFQGVLYTYADVSGHTLGPEMCVPEWAPKNGPQFGHETDNTHCWCCSFRGQILNQKMGPSGGTFSRGRPVGRALQASTADPC